MPVATDYAVAESVSLMATTRPEINPDGIPTWFEWRDTDDAVDFGDAFGAPILTNFMAYACVYVTNEGGTALGCNIGCASDDSIQIIVDDATVHTNSIERGYGAANEVQDVVSGVTLPPGKQVRLLVKVFQGIGGAGFRLRFQDAGGQPIVAPDLSFSLEPTVQPRELFRRGDANADGTLNIADAIYTLGFLFGGQAAPVCRDAADANDDGAVNIADAISILGHLFGGAGPLKPPFGTCGEDPTADTLPACGYPREKC
jgi:hypothetical protein